VLTHCGSEENEVGKLKKKSTPEYLSRIEAGETVISMKAIGLDWDDVGGYDAFVEHLRTRVHGQ
jgi:hypothetical protein